MSIKASFAIKGRNPDVLTCIANLSNDEVFTPPELANRMLDDLAAAWAASNGGKSIWSEKTVRFLDPCAKSGVFLREITKRLVDGLKGEIPDLQERTDHILREQVFGIAITKLTSLLARRSLYCSKKADGKHSIAKSLNSSSGNVWFERIEHSWDGTKCKYCDAPKVHLDRGDEAENYAYAFLHTNDISKHLTSIFRKKMQFDVVIGNPPYQMKGGAGGSSDSSIYHLFVEQAIKLQPKYLSMVIPSRWMAGGRGMDEFRRQMLESKNLVKLADYPVSKEVFPNVEVKGGICYFLWSSHQNTHCAVTQVRGEISKTSPRILDEFDVFVREPIAVNILKKVLAKERVFMDKIVSNREPFKIESNFSGSSPAKKSADIAVYRVDAGKRKIEWMPRKKIEKNPDLVDQWKVLVPKAGSDGGQKIPDSVLGKPWISSPGSVCTGTFLVIPCASQSEAESIRSYYCTKLFRFLVSLRKITQDAFSHMYAWVPQQKWSTMHVDKDLYNKYSLTNDEIAYIESVIKPMDISNDD
jgi:site-specific DNA-methyltransferase (adenine-specific)